MCQCHSATSVTTQNAGVVEMYGRLYSVRALALEVSSDKETDNYDDGMVKTIARKMWEVLELDSNYKRERKLRSEDIAKETGS